MAETSPAWGHVRGHGASMWGGPEAPQPWPAMPSRADPHPGCWRAGAAPPQCFAAAGLLHPWSPGPHRVPRDPLVPPPAAHRAWLCAGPAPGPPCPPRRSGAGQGPSGLARMGLPTRCGHGGAGKLRSPGLADWRSQTGLPWGSRRVSLSPSQNFLFLLLFCIFNYDFLRRESLPGQHCLRWWSFCCKCQEWDIVIVSNLFSRALLK